GGVRNAAARGLPGITVELLDTSGDVLATTVTDRQGRYSFNQLSGPAVNADSASGVSAGGDYEVRLVLPSGTTQTSANPPTIPTSRGDTNVSGVNFSVTPARRGSSTPGWQATDLTADPTDLDGLTGVDPWGAHRRG